MRTSELELRSRLRFLQVARLEGWEVATQFLKATDGTTDDPAVIEARKAVAKNKKDRDEDNAPNKSRRTSSGRSPRDSKQWSRGRGQHQGTFYEQTAGYQFTGANAFTPPPPVLQLCNTAKLLWAPRTSHSMATHLHTNTGPTSATAFTPLIDRLQTTIAAPHRNGISSSRSRPAHLFWLLTAWTHQAKLP